MKIVVLDGFTADQDERGYADLARLGEVTVYPRTTRAELPDRAADADALLTNKVLLDEPILAALPRLRYVGIVATGTNAVDLAACRALDIAVTNVPGYSAASVAQLVFALLLHITHDVAGHDRAVKAGAWATAPDFMFCLRPLTELAGKTLGVAGLGAIGGAVADIARAFGMRVVALRVPGSSSEGRVSLEQGLAESDVVSLHCPLTPETHHLVSASFLRAMKPGAILLNTSRGGLVDDAALMHALAHGTLGAVGLDVVDREPPRPGYPLLDPSAPWAARVVVTPHIGWATIEARRRLLDAAVENLAAFARGESKNRVELDAASQTLSLPP